jgi:hypothetical protein
MTSVVDTQFRARAYAMGIDLFLEKPNTQQEVVFFMDCVESLLGKESGTGFRGVQSKSLVDIIQLECLSQSSSTLKVTQGPLSGKIWFLAGDVIDAECGDLRAEDAFRKVLGWKTGSFEILPAEPDRTRTIFVSYQGLLLESVQALDEAKAADATSDTRVAAVKKPEDGSPLAALTKISGVEFAVFVSAASERFQARGVENPERLAEWVKRSMQQLRALGVDLGAGQLGKVECLGSANNLVIIARGRGDLCVGFNNATSTDMMREVVPSVLEAWGS